ncbi:MAG: energy transducer TonB [Actinobacteria bacterium]|nr:energy transducer TonB [Actinomycetota bacterium]
MLETLLESNSRSERSTVGTLVSVTAHTALIAAAIYATANAGVQPSKPAQMVRPVYFPRLPKPVQSRSSATTARARSFENRRMIFVQPRLDIKAPRIDVGEVGSRLSDFTPGQLSAESTVVGGNGSNSGDAPLTANQVEKQVVLLPGNPTPRYPEALRTSGVEGQVVAVFIVDQQGRTEEASIRFTTSDSPLFEEAVRAALRRMRFAPAEVGGVRVRQLVQMPFLFTLARKLEIP